MRTRQHAQERALPRSLGRGLMVVLWLFLALVVSPISRASSPFPLFGPPPQEPAVVTYKASAGEQAPSDYAALDSWLASRTRVPSVNMLGGDFWLVSRFTPNPPVSDWVVTFDNTYYDNATLWVLGDDGLRKQFESGADTGVNDTPRGTAPVTLTPGHHYAVVIHVTSKFFTALPRIDVHTRAQYHKRRTSESALMLGSLGVLFGLGIFILFVGLWIRDRSYTLYGSQALILVLGWGFFFGVPQGWFGINTEPVNFAQWFILLPVVHARFTIRFLDLKRHAPRMARVGFGIVMASIIALPVSLWIPSLAFLLATAAVSIVVLFSASMGVWSLLHGVRRARFFTLAFMAVLIPGSIILPVNFGLVPSIVDNADLLTLIGNSCEAMLLAFALADHVKLVEDGRERFRRGMQEAIAKASIDTLTGLGNRLAFNVMIEEITRRENTDPAQGTWQIAMIDLDGLKQINDSQGHERGDELLHAVGEGLARLGYMIRAFRLGGDEFALIAYGDELGQQRLTRALAELDRALRESHSPDAGISFGVCSAPANQRQLSSADFAELIREADRTMYAHKSKRRNERIVELPVSELGSE
ncbi:sensor domain-containing diguanylate cyclase [Dyella caseinilytica]|uniref:diguanylate cyclase n=1 Tax=Dyella caseinilytica TaxID=1849581 RepID=A0ABX7GV41_9GAMM|nr:diguanylate cyclase [Dyella caseinilytica]QRN54338.1 GGDEF domain-containing protein [Dyella caseinilytica]